MPLTKAEKNAIWCRKYRLKKRLVDKNSRKHKKALFHAEGGVPDGVQEDRDDVSNEEEALHSAESDGDDAPDRVHDVDDGGEDEREDSEEDEEDEDEEDESSSDEAGNNVQQEQEEEEEEEEGDDEQIVAKKKR
jgi:hypothetical protein